MLFVSYRLAVAYATAFFIAGENHIDGELAET
jgi:hypothetical protein